MLRTFPPPLTPPGVWLGSLPFAAAVCFAFAVGCLVGSMACCQAVCSQMWPLPYIHVLKTIAWDYPFTTNLLATLSGYDVGSVIKTMCISLTRTVLASRASALETWLGWPRRPLQKTASDFCVQTAHPHRVAPFLTWSDQAADFNAAFAFYRETLENEFQCIH